MSTGFWGRVPFFSMLVKVCANIPTTTMSTRKKPSGAQSTRANPLTSQQFWLTLSLCVNFLDQGAVKKMPPPIAHPRDAYLIILEQSLFFLFVSLFVLNSSPCALMGRQGWNHSSRGMVLNWKWFFCPPEDMCQYLETFLFVITGNWVPQTSGGRRPVVHRTAPQSEEVSRLKCQSCVLLTEATQRTGLKDSQSRWLIPVQNGSAMFLVPPALQNLVTPPFKTWSLFYSSVHEI